MTLPVWLDLLLLAVASWRVWYLLAHDDILEVPRRYITRLPRDWQEGDRIPARYRERLADFIQCPYCTGFWVALAWTGFYAAWQEGALWAALPFALNTAVVAAHSLLSAE